MKGYFYRTFFSFVFFVLFCILSFSNLSSAEEEAEPGTVSAASVVAAPGKISSGSSADNFIFTGAATYSIPIEVPPGRQGIAPEIALTYSSQRKNGWIGVGWDIDLGSIRRNTSNGLDYSGHDFVYSKDSASHVLVSVAGSTGCSNEYRVKIDDGGFLRFCTNSTYSAWTVYDKSGRTYSFGSTSGSRKDNPEDPSQVFQWNLDRVEDSNGNYMTITYTKIGGEIYLYRIDYTGNGSLTPTNSVLFKYASQPFTYDEYSKNFRVTSFILLQRIEVYARGMRVSTYELDYDLSGSTMRLLLNEIRKFGSEGASLPPFTFQYSSAPLSFTNGWVTQYGEPDWEWKTLWNITVPWFVPKYFRYKFKDFDGDGRKDVLYIDNQKRFSVALSDGASFEHSWIYQPDFGSSGYAGSKFGDFNGDGKADVLWIGQDETQNVELSTGAGFQYGWTTQLGNAELSRYTCVDFNGDGKTDVLWIDSSGNLSVLLSTGSGFVPGWTTQTADGDSSRYKYADFNGDGKTDIVHIGSNGNLSVLLSTGSDFVAGWVTQFGDGILGLYNLADFNADGKADVVWIDNSYNLSVLLSTGMDFVSGWTSQPGHGTSGVYKYADFNADGKTDVVWVGEDGNQEVLLSTGAAFLPHWTFQYGNGEHYRYAFEDFNGDGKADEVWIDGINAQLNVALVSGCETGHCEVDLCTRIDNGFGATTIFDYTPSVEYNNTQLPFPVMTLSSTTVDDGFYGPAITNYMYGSGYYDIEDREFRGFGYVKKTNPDGTTRETWFHQCDVEENCESPTDEDFKGKPYNVKLREPWPNETTPGELISNIVLEWDRGGTQKGSYPVFVRLGLKDATNYISGIPVTVQEAYTYYDSNGFINTSTTSGTDAESITTKYVYENKGFWLWRPTLVNTVGGVSGKARETSFGYETGTGNMLWKKAWHAEGDDPTVNYTYYPEGNVRTATDPLGNVTTTYYDSTTKTYPVEVRYPSTNPGVSHIVHSEYDDWYGEVRFAWDENGNKTENVLDAFGRVVETVSYVGEGPEIAAKTKTTFDDFTSPVRVITHVLEKINADGTEDYIDTYTYFDGLGRNIETISQGENQTIVTTTYYDEMGRPYYSAGPFFGNGFGYSQSPSPPYPWTLITYNYRGNPEEIESPDDEHGSVISAFSYSGLSTLAIDPDGKKREEKRDYLGRVVEVKEYGDNGEVYTTSYSYNAAGNLLEVSRMGTETSLNSVITYDTLGRKKTMEDPDMGFWRYFYDLNGNLTEQIDAKGQTITLAYDELNRLKTKNYYPSEPGVTYYYDNESVSNGRGRLHKVEAGPVTDQINSYDSMGRATSVSKTIGSEHYMTLSEYDLAGRLKSITYPDNYHVDYVYHPGTGFIRMVNGYEGVHAEFNEYTPAGAASRIGYGNDAQTFYDFDPWSNRLRHLEVSTPSSNPLDHGTYPIDNEYRYFRAGDISAVYDRKKAAKLHLDYFMHEYNYDNLHRFNNETTTNTYYDPVHYTYFDNGNIKKKSVGGTVFTYAYEPADKPHAVKSITVNSVPYDYTYDANGNMVSGYDLTDPASPALRQITYNAENMPVQIVYTKDGVSKTTNYTYGDGGVRAKKVVEGGKTTYYVGEHYEVVDGQPVKYVFGGGMRIARVDGSGIYYYHKDHLGSTSAMTDSLGNELENSNYAPFGKVREHLGQTLTNYTYTDQELDPETGMYYYDARYYDATIGRFITPDSIVPDPFNPQSFNRYAYVLNNPVKYTDPTGHYDITVTNPYGEDPDGGYSDDGYADGGYEGDCPIFTCEEWSTGGRKVGDAFEDAYDSADDFINDSLDSIFGGSDFIDKEIEKAKRQAAQRYYAQRKAYAAKNSYGQTDSVSNNMSAGGNIIKLLGGILDETSNPATSKWGYSAGTVFIDASIGTFKIVTGKGMVGLGLSVAVATLVEDATVVGFVDDPLTLTGAASSIAFGATLSYHGYKDMYKLITNANNSKQADNFPDNCK